MTSSQSDGPESNITSPLYNRSDMNSVSVLSHVPDARGLVKNFLQFPGSRLGCSVPVFPYLVKNKSLLVALSQKPERRPRPIIVTTSGVHGHLAVITVSIQSLTG